MLKSLLAVTTASCFLSPLFAQMTADQRMLEFEALAGLFARVYAPANWKQVALGVNLFNAKPYADRVRAAKDDIEFFEICAEYLATLQDGHVRYAPASNFFADLGLVTDIYDGKLLIEFIDRSRYPATEFPFQLGDEVVSIDGRPVGSILSDLVRFRGFGNPRGALRLAADSVVFRPQQVIPRAIELPDTTQVVIRRESGDLETYQLTWRKAGVPFRNVSPVPWPIFGKPRLLNAPDQDPLAFYRQLQWGHLSDIDQLNLERTLVDDSGETVTRQGLLGWGSRLPYYSLPAGFVVRRGLLATDAFFSGTYTSEGLRIGFIRLPNFTPPNAAQAARDFEQEIIFFRANTDGLVIDDSRNTGGLICLSLDYAQRLIPRPFQFIEFQFRPSQLYINSFESALRSARNQGAEQWIIDTYQFILTNLLETARANRALTGPLPLCTPFTGPLSAPTVDNLPATDAQGNVIAYDKPLIVLVDEFSVSTGDIFPAVIQDAKRGLIVGMRTGGLGGSNSSALVGPYSESVAGYTQALAVRHSQAEAPGLPRSPYLENTGVIPDIQLDYMTRENLITRGRPFVEGFTRIIVEEIRKAGVTP